MKLEELGDEADYEVSIGANKHGLNTQLIAEYSDPKLSQDRHAGNDFHAALDIEFSSDQYTWSNLSAADAAAILED